MATNYTLSVIKADVGGFVGHSSIHEDLINEAGEQLEAAQAQNLLVDYHVTACGDDLQLIMTHYQGEDDEGIHRLAWETFEACTRVAKRLKLYGAGQDLLADAFSGNVKGMGPGVAEMAFEERRSEPIIIFMADKTSAGAWNLPLYRIFADPFNTAGLVISPSMHQGFRFEVQDVKQDRAILLDGQQLSLGGSQFFFQLAHSAELQFRGLRVVIITLRLLNLHPHLVHHFLYHAHLLDGVFLRLPLRGQLRALFLQVGQLFFDVLDPTIELGLVHGEAAAPDEHVPLEGSHGALGITHGVVQQRAPWNVISPVLKQREEVRRQNVLHPYWR